MKFENKNIVLKTILLLCIFFLQPLNSKAMDPGYNGDKPLFVEISTDWCFACKILEPIIEELKKEYAGQVTFIKLNPTSDETLQVSQETALNFGISEFFNGNRNAFPRVAIYCPGGLSPTNNLLGANTIDLYRNILNDLVFNSTTTCSLNGRPPIADNAAGRPDEPEQIEIITGRPDEAKILDRPQEFRGSGRPNELSFWTYGQPMPLYTYLHSLSLTLPECTGANQTLCYKGNDKKELQQSSDGQKPAFKPYNPNITRDEKGLHFK